MTTPEEIESLVRLLMRETVSEEATRVYREIWVLALDDEVISDAVNRLYDQCMGSFVEHLSRAYPDLDVAVLQEFAQTLAVMLEGTSVLYGTSCDRVVPYERSVQISIELLRGMLQKGQIGPPRI